MNCVSKRERVSLCQCWNLNALYAEHRDADIRGRTLVTKIQERPIELYPQQKEAKRDRSYMSRPIRPQRSARRSAAGAP
jgi:hypothetical protein